MEIWVYTCVLWFVWSGQPNINDLLTWYLRQSKCSLRNSVGKETPKTDSVWLTVIAHCMRRNIVGTSMLRSYSCSGWSHIYLRIQQPKRKRSNVNETTTTAAYYYILWDHGWLRSDLWGLRASVLSLRSPRPNVLLPRFCVRLENSWPQASRITYGATCAGCVFVPVVWCCRHTNPSKYSEHHQMLMKSSSRPFSLRAAIISEQRSLTIYESAQQKHRDSGRWWPMKINRFPFRPHDIKSGTHAL